MKQIDIVREHLGETLNLDTLSESIHQAAQDVLGYSCKEKTNRSLESESLLLGALQSLGIEILNEKSVRQYQGQMVARAYEKSTPTPWDWEWTSNPGWERKDLKKYTRPVPDFAIERALQIKELCPDVEFYVEELVDQVDPFLIAHIGREGYYIACWEEAEFTGGN